MKSHVALAILIGRRNSDSDAFAPECALNSASLLPRPTRDRIPSLRLSTTPRLAVGSSSTSLAYKSGRPDNDDLGEDSSPELNESRGDEDTSSSSHTEASSSPQIYSDEDCYDLCDIFDAEESSAGDISGTAGESTRNTLGGTTSVAPSQDTSSSTSSTSTTSTRKSILGNPLNSPYHQSLLNSTSPIGAKPRNPEQIRQNLELHWQVTSSDAECDVEDIQSCSDQCTTCRGTGRIECRFCGGTGFLTIGEVVVGAGGSCPICNADGEEDCGDCRGSGWVAGWRHMNLTGSGGGGR